MMREKGCPIDRSPLCTAKINNNQITVTDNEFKLPGGNIGTGYADLAICAGTDNIYTVGQFALNITAAGLLNDYLLHDYLELPRAIFFIVLKSTL
jgi:hypothetical protein